MLFETWSATPHRATRDVDLLGYGDSSAESATNAFREICSLEVEPDGIVMLPDTVRAEPTMDQQEYQGVRVRMAANLDGARVPLQVDIGFGDVVTPAIAVVNYPTLLEFPAPQLRTYPMETVVAEKFEAMVRLGVANTRMKDFYDLGFLAQTFPFEGATLSNAFAATFRQRGTALPVSTPVALSAEFSDDAGKRQQWVAFLSRTGLPGTPTLGDIIDGVARFVLPPALAASAGQPFDWTWPPGGDWRPGPQHPTP